MKWSQLKVRVEALLAESVKGRVAYYSTRYRHSHDSEGRGWITVDGVQILDMSTLRAWADQHHRAAAAMGYPDKAGWDHWDQVRNDANYWQRWHEAEAERLAAGVFTAWDFNQALWDYHRMSLADALGSENVLIRAVAVVDGRLGKRRFQRLRPRPDEHPLVWALYRLRAEAEGWGQVEAATRAG
jgi:hypothetical protein